MVIQLDSREKPKAIQKIIADFNADGVKYFVSKLPVGDYMSLDNPKLVIDRKQNLAELCANISDVPVKDSKGRFVREADGSIRTPLKRLKREFERAQEYGIKLIILCEHGGQIHCLEDVPKWHNPRLKESPLAVSGERLYRILAVLGKRYGVDFVFCDKRQTGKRIIEILSGGM